MNRSIIFTTLLLAFCLFISCDVIDKPYTNDDTIDPITPPIEGNVLRKVFLEDYTGHKCTNCPNAHEVAHHLKKTYGDSLVLISIHAGYFAEPSSSMPADYRTTEGERLHNDHNITEVPIGLINRKENGERFAYSNWEKEVEKEIKKDASATISIRANYDADNATISADVDVKFVKETMGKFNLCVFITESGIVSPQLNGNPSIGPTEIDDYEHHHMLRGSMNGAYGKMILDGKADLNMTYSEPNSIKVKDEWDVEEMTIIAFVLNQETKEVIQVEEVRVIQ